MSRMLRDLWHASFAGVYGINRRNVDLVHAYNQRHQRRWADDKILCKQALSEQGIPVPRTLACCTDLGDVQQVVEELTSYQEFVVKPARGSGGRGVLLLGQRVEGGWLTSSQRFVAQDELRRRFADIVFGAHGNEVGDRVLVEERVQPHPLLHQLWPDGLCDIRVLVLEGKALLAMMRLPTRRSHGKSNLHQGGIGVALDLESGRLVRAVSGSQEVSEHPDTGLELLTLTVPDWDVVLEVARRAALAVPLGYLGVDVSIDRQRGPLVLELNARPGLEIQNICGRGLGEILGNAA